MALSPWGQSRRRCGLLLVVRMLDPGQVRTNDFPDVAATQRGDARMKAEIALL